jgi:WhiB family redox-sensing transcriptional regulator
MRVTVSLSDREKRWDWRDDAQCREVPPELMWPGDGDNWGARDAKAVCHRCDVRTQCLEWAVEHYENEGIWGGMTPRERMTIRRQRRDQTDAAVMGT